MTTGISNEDCMRELLWGTVEPLTQVKEGYDKSIRTLESKRIEGIPLSKNPAFQAEVDKTHAIYMQYIETSITNLKAQIAIGEEIKALFARRDIDLGGLSASLAEIQSRLSPLLAQRQVNAAEIKKLEDKIVELIS